MKKELSPPRRADEVQFRDIHAENYLDLVRFVDRRMPGDQAEDIVSQVFMTAWQKVADMPLDARPWLFGIARNHMRNALRGEDRRRDLDVDLAADMRDGVDSAESSAARLDFVRAWRRLDPQDRETLALVGFDGLTTEQAATVLGCRRSTFTMRLTRARRRLRDALDDISDRTSAPLTKPNLEALSWNA